MSFTVGPERYSAPPVEIWMMPSAPASAKPLRAALSVWDEETLIAGKAKAPALAASSISAYFSGVAMGMLVGSCGSAGAGRLFSTYRDNRSVVGGVSPDDGPSTQTHPEATRCRTSSN